MQAFEGNLDIKNKYIARAVAMRITGQEKCPYDPFDDCSGIPRWLMQLEDCLWKGLPRQKRSEWLIQFLSAITPGVDLERVKRPFIISVLETTLTLFDHTTFSELKAFIDRVIVGWQTNFQAPTLSELVNTSYVDIYAVNIAAYIRHVAINTINAAKDSAISTALGADTTCIYQEAGYISSAVHGAANTAFIVAYSDYPPPGGDIQAAEVAREKTYEQLAERLLQLLRECK